MHGPFMVGMRAQRRRAAPRTRSRADVVESCAVLPNELRLEQGLHSKRMLRYKVNRGRISKSHILSNEAARINLTRMSQPTIPG